MGIAHPTPRMEVRKARARTRSKTRTLHAAQPLQADERAPEMDQLNFRIVARDGKHFFKNVRFKPPHFNVPFEQSVLDFFEGRCLESIGPRVLDAALGPSPFLPRLRRFVNDLREIVCD